MGTGNSYAILLAMACCLLPGTASGNDIVITVEAGNASLNSVLAEAGTGDILQLSSGIFKGPIIIEQSIRLIGGENTIIDGGLKGNTVTVDAPDVVMRNLIIRNSGTSLFEENSGIFLTSRAERTLVDSNRIENNLIGIYLKGPANARVVNNTVIGRTDRHMNSRGNNIHIWNSPGSVVENNRIKYGRDGIFVTTSNDNRFAGNRFSDLRFGVHYMYTNNSEIIDNTSTGNHIGYALMYSHHLHVSGNRSDGDRDRGLLFNFANYSRIDNNTVNGETEKCVFIYNSNNNLFYENLFQNCDIGIHFTAGSEDNTIWGNAFINNRTQVKYVGTRHLEWSREDQGNYWSDHNAFDLNGDGIADRPYMPNDLTDQIIWRYPLARILVNSPVFQILAWSQSRFPGLHPGGIVDSSPLMTPATGAAGHE